MKKIEYRYFRYFGFQYLFEITNECIKSVCRDAYGNSLHVMDPQYVLTELTSFKYDTVFEVDFYE